MQKLIPPDLYVFAEVGLFGFLFAGTRCFGLWRGFLLRRSLMLLWRRLMLLRSGLVLWGCRFRRTFCTRRSSLTFWLCSRRRLRSSYRFDLRTRRL